MEEFKVGDRVIVEKAHFLPNENGALSLTDVEGEITSIKDITVSHFSIYKYEITLPMVKIYTNNDGDLAHKQFKKT